MNKKLIFCAMFSMALLSSTVPVHGASKKKIETKERVVVERSNEEIEGLVDELISKMTLKEKIGQLYNPVAFSENLKEDIEAIRRGEIGSFTVVKRTPMSVEYCNTLQKAAIEESRLGIPILMGLDVIHGYNTMYPNPLGMAASWDEAAMEKACAMAASEAAPMGADVTYSPNLDVCREPRWGRIAETAGEDQLLSARMGAAAVRGYQGAGLANVDKRLGACGKHLVGYGASMGGRDKQFTEISDRTLHELYLPPFEAAAKAGAVSFMAAFNDISGVPASGNSYVMRELLKEKWNWDGFIISDWDSVVELINHGVAGNFEDAARIALNAGLDVEMKSTCFVDYLPKLIESGAIKMEILDDAVRRMLRIKYRLGLFDNPYRDAEVAKAAQLTDSNRQLVREIAASSMVLLKNGDEKRVLPLNEGTSVAVTGRLAKTRDLYGHWKGFGSSSDLVTPYDGLVANALKGMNVQDATTTEVDADVAIVCVGEESSVFGESDNMSDITLNEIHIKAIKDAKEKYETVIAVVFCGRPVVLSPIVDYADAILVAWHPGTEAGNALADVLYGKVSPSGKTPVSFLKKSGQIPLYYSARLSGRPRNNYYEDVDGEALYPFGYGLGYGYLSYDKMSISSNTMKKDGSIKVTVNIRNNGMDCYEVVQLYVHDVVASVTRPKKELKDFKKVFIRKSETVEVTFDLTAEQLAFYNIDVEKVIEPGEFDVWVGSSSDDKDLQHKTISIVE